MRALLLLKLLIFFSVICQAQFNSTFGGPFTPHGDIRFLMVFAGFENECEEAEGSIWPNKDRRQHREPCKTLPLYHDRLFYSDFSQFSPDATDISISNFYYQMSRHHPSQPPLRIVTDIFPERINIQGSVPDNIALFKAMQEKYPDFDWSRYDRRKNDPDFRFDNASTGPDHKIDYIIVIWRKYTGVPYAGTSYFRFTTSHNGNAETYEISPSCGFTIEIGMQGDAETMIRLFHHELAHTLFNCPHLFSTSEVNGNYFYASNGWGLMSYGIILSSANAWESWYNGWIELPPDRDLSNYTHNGVYTLKDFASTGEAIRIKLPFVSQYLWIENHTGATVFDKRIIFRRDGYNDSIPPAKMGLFMFIENIAGSRSKRIDALSSEFANGLKSLHSRGNYDYEVLDWARDQRWWNNYVINFQPLRANPTSAHNDITWIRDNYAYDTIHPDDIIYRTYTNNGRERSYGCGRTWNTQAGQEAQCVIRKNGVFTYDYLGTDMAFGSDLLPQKIGISSNPLIINHQRYLCPDKLEPICLNGISINILSRSANGEITFEVKFDDTRITSDQRFTGDLVLKDIPHAAVDLHITEGNTLTIDKSGSPNRFNKGDLVQGSYEFPDFINPTMFTVDSNAYVLIEDKASVLVAEGSTLRLCKGSILEIRGKGKLKIARDSYLCIDPGATIKIMDRKKNIKMKGTMGVNKKLKLPPIPFLKEI